MMDSDLESNLSSQDGHDQHNLLTRASQFLKGVPDAPILKGRHETLQESTESDMLGGMGDIFALQEEDEAEEREIHLEHSSSRRKPVTPARDSGWLVAYLTCFVLLLVIAIWAYLIANSPSVLPSLPNDMDDAELEEATSLLSVIPLITTLTLISIAGSMATLFLLSQAVKRILYALLFCGPAFIVSTAFWTWGESWSNSLRGINDGQIGTEARWACLAALVVAGLSARMIYNRLDKVDKTIQVIEVRGDARCQLDL
jgi:hypothetical protein